MRDLLPSGRFAQLARLSRKALRIYAEMQLLRPVHVNADNGYWYYSLGQLEDARRITQLRDLGMSLETIQQAVRVWNSPALKTHLEQQRTQLLEQATKVEAALAALDSLLLTPRQSYPVQSKNVAAQTYVGTRAWIAPEEACTFIGAVQARLLQQLQAVSLRPTGAVLARYHTETEDAWDVEVCVPINQADTVFLAPEVMHGKLPSGQVAYTIHDGDCCGSNGMQAAFTSVWTWLRDHGHDVAGGPFEVYLFDETNTENIQDYRTEIGWLLADN